LSPPVFRHRRDDDRCDEPPAPARPADRGIRDHGLPYPIALDNEFATWRVFGNDAWPAKYLFNTRGTPRVRRHRLAHERQRRGPSAKRPYRFREQSTDTAPHRDPVGYLRAALFQWVNPKSWLVTASAAGTFLSAGAGSPIVQAACLGGLFVLAALADVQHRDGRAARALDRPDRALSASSDASIH
jgi:hypothetical protein